MKTCKLLITLLVLLLFSAFSGSCEDQLLNDEFKGGDWFYLENDGSVMPVWVRGNKSSNVFIIFLHGGPGDTALDSAISRAHAQLQNEYAFVYYDQRGSGAAQGNAKPESFTVEQFVEDLQKIVYLIRHKYSNPAIFLMGHSWGGGLGTAYLLNTNRQQFISGWITIDGLHNAEDGMTLSWEWVTGKAIEKINSGVDVNYWQNEIGWYNNTTPLFRKNILDRHSKNIDKLNGYFLNSANRPSVSYLWGSYAPLLFILNNLNMMENINLENFNLSSEMYRITVPSLVLWGRHDGIFPVVLAQNTFDDLGTKANDKYLYIFESSAHSPHFEEPDPFYERVKMFVDKYK